MSMVSLPKQLTKDARKIVEAVVENGSTDGVGQNSITIPILVLVSQWADDNKIEPNDDKRMSLICAAVRILIRDAVNYQKRLLRRIDQGVDRRFKLRENMNPSDVHACSDRKRVNVAKCLERAVRDMYGYGQFNDSQEYLDMLKAMGGQEERVTMLIEELDRLS